MRKHVTLALAAFVGLGFLASAPVKAQPNVPNIEKLKQMKVSGTDLNIPLVPQTGKNADQLRENLKRVKLPPGFKIDLYAVVPDARHDGGRAVDQHAVRRHAQDHRVGGDQPQQRRHGDRGEGIRALAQVPQSQRACAGPGTAS